MESKTTTRTRKLGVAMAVAMLVLSVAGVVAAQAGPTSECTDTVATFGVQTFGLGDGGNRLMSTQTTVREYAIDELPAGTYDLNGVSYDGYEWRATVDPQPEEQWYAELLSASGTVLATSGTTADIEDGVTEATWSGSLGQVTIAEPASTIRVSHIAPGVANPNSVRPICLGATPVDTTPTTTEAPAPTSSVTVDFVSTATSSSSVVVTCADQEESATGNEILLAIGDIPGSTGCVVEFPADLECTVTVDPASTTGAVAAGIQNITIPEEGDVAVNVVIRCADAVDSTTTTTAVPAVTTTTTAPAVTTTTAKPVDTQVEGQVETAPTATAQTGTPAFTG